MDVFLYNSQISQPKMLHWTIHIWKLRGGRVFVNVWEEENKTVRTAKEGKWLRRWWCTLSQRIQLCQDSRFFNTYALLKEGEFIVYLLHSTTGYLKKKSNPAEQTSLYLCVCERESVCVCVCLISAEKGQAKWLVCVWFDCLCSFRYSVTSDSHAFSQ